MDKERLQGKLAQLLAINPTWEDPVVEGEGIIDEILAAFTELEQAISLHEGYAQQDLDRIIELELERNRPKEENGAWAEVARIYRQEVLKADANAEDAKQDGAG